MKLSYFFFVLLPLLDFFRSLPVTALFPLFLLFFGIGDGSKIGMAFAARRSEGLDLCPAGTSERLVALLTRAGLPTELPDFPRRAYLQALRVAKKKREARIRFVALRGIGGVEIVPLLPGEIIPRMRAKSRR